MAVLLIVEDDTATNEAICEYMSSAGHKVLSAFDGEHGLQIAREKSIDLVVLDIMLPKRTGLEVLKELRQTSGIPVPPLTMSLLRRPALMNRRTTISQNPFPCFCWGNG